MMQTNGVAQSVYAQYAVMDGYGNGVADGLANFSVNGNEVLFEESNGDKFSVDIEKLALSDEQMAELMGTTKTGAAKETDEAKNTEATDAEGIQGEIDNLNKQKAETLEMMEKIEAEVEKLAQDAEEKITEAAKAQEAKVEDYEDQVKSAIEQNVTAYVAANKADGKGMTQDELQSNVKNSIDGFAPDLSDTVAGLFAANSEINLIDSHLSKLNSLANTVKDFDSQIATKETALKQAKEAEAAAKKSCDPIGFKDAEGNTFDFVVMDEDGFNTTSDFLGADNNWDSMAALDTSNDGKVDLAELEAGKIGLTMNGSKDLMDANAIKEMFGEDFAIDLKSYDKNGTYDGITDADADGNGVVDQDLQGTFNITAGGKTLNGYNTLDDQEWLANQYGLEANVTETGAPKAGANVDEVAENDEELQSHLDFIETYTQKAQDLRDQLKLQWQSHGMSNEYIEMLNESAGQVATSDADKFYSEIEVTEKQEDAEATDVQAAEGADNQGNDQDKDDEEEEQQAA